ncbi:50S ribosomal protein L24 [Candidatus Uhrbacteria bacterium]|nr:50S ribosomal protein L24 [Candidatus Uhrbacteria bacterium]
MKIRKGDTVKILAGKDKGKSGAVLKVFPEEGRLIVEGLNLVVKHVRPRKQGEKGQKLYIPARMYAAKVMLVCTQCRKASRAGYAFIDTNGVRTKQRVCKQCKQRV